MRPIKYKAYIKQFDEVYDVNFLSLKQFPWEDYLRAYLKKEHEEWEVTNYRMDGIDNHLMQYTGLNDKNGIEIYEWYLLSFPYWRNVLVHSVEYGEYNVGDFGDIESIHMGWTMDGQPLPMLNQICEVIWNTYKNPELITKEEHVIF